MPDGAIGYRDEFTPEELDGKHIDGVTGLVFDTEEDYLNHTSPETGHTPKDLEHQDILTDGQFSRVADAAIERGEERKGEEVPPAVAYAEEIGEPVDAPSE